MLLATSLVTTEKWHSWMAKLSQDATARLPPAQLKENAWLKDSPTLEPWRPKMRIVLTMEVQATHSKRGSPDTSRIWKTKPSQEQLCPTSFGIWRRNSPSETPQIKWTIVNRCHPLKAGMPVWDVCLTEKTRLLLQHEGPEPKPPKNTVFLNRRSEIYTKCRHRRKFTLRYCHNLYAKVTRG